MSEQPGGSGGERSEPPIHGNGRNHEGSGVPPERKDEQYWAKPVAKLGAPEAPEGVLNLNVEGRRVSGFGGFGKMWQKTYRVSLEGIDASPADIIKAWKENFPSFWPAGNRFYGPLTGISPGDVALINMTLPGKLKLSTGVLVIYADDESFSFMSPEGHMFSGMITFSAGTLDDALYAQAQVLIRAQDPLYELGMALGGHRKEDRFWAETLQSLAAHFGVKTAPQTERVCVDRRRNWSKLGNVKHNAAIRSALYAFVAPFRPRRRRNSG